MKPEDVNRMNRLLEETEAFLNERGATLLNNAIAVAPNDYGIASAAVKIDLIRRDGSPS
jgi:Tfp pilus assembly protein PilN